MIAKIGRSGNLYGALAYNNLKIEKENGQILFDAGGLSHWDRLIIQLEDGAEMEGLEIISPVVKTKFLPDFKFRERN